MKRVAVIGGGAAGMIAAAQAASRGNEVTLFEKNEKLGKKIYITGKGRCNVTNACPLEDFFDAVIRNPKFLYSSLYSFSNLDLIQVLRLNHLETKTERGDRVFPVSDKSSDVIKALERNLMRNGVTVMLNNEVSSVKKTSKGFELTTPTGTDVFASVIVATGGLCYPSTGSTGDGYRFAKEFGLQMIETRPALCPIILKDSFIPGLQGLSLKNVELSLFEKNRLVYSEVGEMLFTQKGISGPLVLTASSYMLPKKQYSLYLDLKPGLTISELDDRILRDFEKHKNKQLISALSELTVKKLIPILLEIADLAIDKKTHQVTKLERQRLVNTLKYFPLTVDRTADYNEAVVTAGGISVSEINPSTMESKKIPGLFFCGEVLDIDALTGGYNLQIAFSTGFQAGNNV